MVVTINNFLLVIQGEAQLRSVLLKRVA